MFTGFTARKYDLLYTRTLRPCDPSLWLSHLGLLSPEQKFITDCAVAQHCY